MLVKILAWFWIITGIVFLFWPQILKKRLQKKSYKIVKKYLFSIAIFFGILLITAAWRAEGGLAKLLFILGLIALFKGIFLLKAKTSEKIIQWYAKQPDKIYRIFAGCQIGLGLAILWLIK